MLGYNIVLNCLNCYYIFMLKYITTFSTRLSQFYILQKYELSWIQRNLSIYLYIYIYISFYLSIYLGRYKIYAGVEDPDGYNPVPIAKES